MRWFFYPFFPVIPRAEFPPFVISQLLHFFFQEKKCWLIVLGDCYSDRHWWVTLCQGRVLWRAAGKGHPSQNSSVRVYHEACLPDSLHLVYPFLPAFHSWEWSMGERSCSFPHSCVCSPFIFLSPSYLGSKLHLWINSLSCFWLLRTDKVLVVILVRKEWWWSQCCIEQQISVTEKSVFFSICYLQVFSSGPLMH